MSSCAGERVSSLSLPTAAQAGREDFARAVQYLSRGGRRVLIGATAGLREALASGEVTETDVRPAAGGKGRRADRQLKCCRKVIITKTHFLSFRFSMAGHWNPDHVTLGAGGNK